VTQNSVGGGVVSYTDVRKNVTGRRCGLRSSENELPERRFVTKLHLIIYQDIGFEVFTAV
jgi:hypothetical protein